LKFFVWKELFMGVRNRSKETLDRLAAKTLDARFLHEIEPNLPLSSIYAAVPSIYPVVAKQRDRYQEKKQRHCCEYGPEAKHLAVNQETFRLGVNRTSGNGRFERLAQFAATHKDSVRKQLIFSPAEGAYRRSIGEFSKRCHVVAPGL
jgi:hypothetical protein